MKQACIFVLAVFAFTPGMFGQDGVPIIKAEVMSAFVWGEDDRQTHVRLVRDRKHGSLATVLITYLFLLDLILLPFSVV